MLFHNSSKNSGFLRKQTDTTSRGTIHTIDGARKRAVEDAWKMEIQMVRTIGRGTAEWSDEALELLKAGKKVPGYVGDHITSVSADLTKAADH